jgi:phosphatidate cytidylyltransferase
MSRSSGELTKRVLVALVGIPIALAVAYLGGVWIAATLAILAAVAAWELCAMYRRAGSPASPGAAAMLAPAYVALAALDPGPGFIIWGTAVTLAVATALMLLTDPRTPPGQTVMVTVFAAAYPGVLLSFGVWLRGLDASAPGLGGAAILFLPVAITWLGDTAAYFGGRAVGRHKLAPRISPAKTWEGAVAGLAATAGGAVLYVQLTGSLVSWTLSPAEALIVGVAVALAGQAGDLFESRFKRDCNVKDSSNLIPGHGGVLDRLDSLLFALPAALATLRMLGV